MPDPQRLINTVKRAAQLFRATPGRRGMVVQLDATAEDVLVAGDLHGNLAHFQVLLDRARLDRNPRRHLVVQEIVHGTSRYPSGGCKSHQLVDVVAALKCQYPDRVHLILGNHELAEVGDRTIVKAGERTNQLFRQGIESAYGPCKDEVYGAYRELFRSCSLAVRTCNRVFICHSLPEAKRLDSCFDGKLFEAESLDQLSSQRGSPLHSLLWGRDSSEPTARRFAALVNADLLITGHLPCPEGFHTPNPLQLVLDSSRYPACYCLFSNQQPCTLSDLVASVISL
ncbi:MAG: metallophosphoesterase [Planctomycetes bacterium]|nr:metallophosphoesterase [Planctomycetota bacterium]